MLEDKKRTDIEIPPLLIYKKRFFILIGKREIMI